MKSIRLKWFSLIVTLFLAFGTVFSVATAALPEAKAYDADVTVNVQEIVVPAGQTSTFTVYADAKQGFSSYAMHFAIPYFMQVLEIESEIDVYNGVFEYNGTYVTFSSTQQQSGYVALFTVTFTTDATASGKTDFVYLQGSSFINVDGDYLSVAEYNGKIAISGEYSRKKGDFDGDGNVNIQDVMYMQRFMVGTYNRSVNETDIWAGDIDGVNGIDIRDCQLVQSYIIGIIGPLENYGGGENPHGGDEPHYNIDEICKIYVRDGESVELYTDRTFSLNPDGVEPLSGTYRYVGGNTVYLVKDYMFGTIYIDVDAGSFEHGNGYVFTDLNPTVEGYQDTYRVNGSTEDTVTVATNGAFIRTCIEDGNEVQYNGMIVIHSFDQDKGEADGTAFVFGTSAYDCDRAIDFTMDMRNKVIYVQQEQHEKLYNVRFYVDDEMVADYSVAEGTPYQDVYNQFMNEKAEMLNKKYGGTINFKEYSTDTNTSIFGDSCVTSDDAIRFTAKDQTVWTENERVYSASSVRLVENNKWENYTITLYYYATREDIVNALVGTTVQVSKVYVNEQGKNKYEIFDNVTITAEMIGDTSKIDFTPNGSSYPKIPLTIDGRTAKLSVHVIADMRGAKLLNSGVSETVYYSGGIPTSSYYLVKIYDNGYMVRYQIGSDGNVGPNVSSYQEYSTETYDGVTLYAIGTPTCYFVLEGNIVLGEMRYQKFVGYQHSEGQETTDYTFPITMMGMDMSFKVFNGEFAEMYTPSFISGGLVYSGTVKVVIENGILNFGGVEYIISENNILSLTLPEGEPFLTANIGGPEAWFYEDGAGFAVYGGQPIMAFTWIGNADLSVITFNMMGEDGSFYKWMIDGIYHYNEEPEWDAAWSIFELTYVKDGESKNYTLYKFEQSVYYLSDGDTVQNVDGGYQANIFEMDGDMGNASKYYYYNAEGEMHDAIRYHVEDETGTGFGYMYAVPAKGILVGYWQATGVNISSEEFTFTVNGDGNYVVSYNGKWLYTATPEMATNPSKDNKLIVTDYAVKQENDGEVIGEGAYKLNVYNVFNGEIMGPTELNVNSYKEFENKIYQILSEHPDAPTLCGFFYDIDGKKPVTSENFRSGDIYMLFEEKN